MANKKNPKPGAGEDGNNEPTKPDDEATEELIQAEGPDVETSFTDEDLAFLTGQPAGAPESRSPSSTSPTSSASRRSLRTIASASSVTARPAAKSSSPRW
jgi:hypothetical protein